MEKQAPYDLTDIRVEQAQMLKSRVVASCVYVLFLICNYSIILMAVDANYGVDIWFAASTTMVFITYLYAKYKCPDGITRNNVKTYLRGHVLICCITGIIWGTFAILMVQWQELATLLIAVFLICGITIGGVLPGSAYRPGYLALAIFALVPFSIFTFIMAPWPLWLMGVAILVYFAFGFITSKRGEMDMQESIAMRQKSEEMAKIEAENTIIRRVNEEKTRFLAATSHDLSQPLHAQGYFIQALKEKVADPAQVDLLAKIEQTWRRQGDFLRGLIDINRLDSGAIIPKSVLVDIEADMIALVDEFLPITAVNRVSLTAHLQAAQASTDPVLLNRIIRNLLSNAVRYTQEGGEVEIKIAKHETDIQVIVKDNGPGIPENEQSRIFEEYTQLSEQAHSQKRGVGLGLSIVQRLTDLLGFQLTLQSTVGQGTCFTLTLPQADLNDETSDASDNSIEKVTPSFEGMPLIVLVDDDAGVRDGMASLLTDWGCQLIAASGPDEAISLLSVTGEMPSLFIIDRCLGPGQNGSDLIEALRDEVNEDIPAILMSGEPHEPRVDEMPSNVTFLRKPVAPDAIQQHMRNAIT